MAAISEPLAYQGPYAQELAEAVRIAVHAGDIPLRYHGQALEVEHKFGNEPVTLADRECSEFLVATLGTAFPGDILISEEAEDDLRRLQSPRVWYIDPIDGTKAFIKGGTGYCVMLGLAVQHQPVVGVLYQPNHKTLIYACKGGGAWSKRGSSPALRLQCSPVDKPTNARILAHHGSDRRAVIDAFGLPLEEPIRSIGLKLAVLALGACELYANPATNCSTWDTCGPQVILEEAGGRLTDMHGDKLRYDNAASTSLEGGIVASNGPMHELFLERLALLFPGTSPHE